jgi:hypothetical protein
LAPFGMDLVYDDTTADVTVIARAIEQRLA